METMAGGRLWTAEQLQDLGDDSRYEIDEGVLVPMSPATRRHAVVAAQVLYLVKRHVTEGDLGEGYAAETGFRLARDPDVVLAPDVSFVSRQRLPEAGDDDSYVQIAPDLAVEVVSPHDRAQRLERKVQQWLAGGVRAVWVVYPRSRSVTVYTPAGTARRLPEEATLDGETGLPGFRCRVSDLF